MSNLLDELRLVHETPGRLRFRGPVLGSNVLSTVVVESWLESLAEIHSVRLNRRASTLIVEYDGGMAGRDKVLRRLESFKVPKEPEEGGDADHAAEWTPLALTGATLVALPFLRPRARRLLTLLNISPTLAKGVDALINRGVNVEVLDALAVGLAAARDEHYTANITDFLLALGEFLEHQTEHQSNRLLRRLLRPDPALAWVERDGELIQVQGDEVRQDEIVVVGVGERIPVDGRVVEGVALVNQAAVTGEDVPVRKEAPRRVISGSVIADGRIRIQATQVGEDTTSARIARFIQESLDKRSDTQRLADELADRRVYLTLGTGALVHALTRDLRRLQAVFLVDYSCALKLGTPVAFKSGMYQAAAHGVLLKGGEAIEHLAAVDTVVFDKTGTLTHSELAVTDVEVLSASQWTAAELLAMVASVEEHASHPVAKAVVDAARERDLQHITHGEVDYLVAHGMTAAMKGGQIVIGSRHYLEDHQGITFTDDQELIDRLQNEGKTLLYIGNRNGPVGLIALRDTLRQEAPAALRRLRSLGVRRLIMITGDRRQKAQALAAELGIDEVHAEIPPEDKARIIEQLQAAGSKVAFVGDGVNDGPALATAEVGIAMPRGADIARATADVVLMDDRLSAVADARELASRTMNLIRTNFNLAVGINTGILAGAIAGGLSPVASALLHNGTTIGILFNALSGVRLSGAEPSAQSPAVASDRALSNRN